MELPQKGMTELFKVLLVDDEPAALAMVKRAIERRTTDFEVVAEAFSVDAAIPLYNELHPDVVVTDMKMPQKTGLHSISCLIVHPDVACLGRTNGLNQFKIIMN